MKDKSALYSKWVLLESDCNAARIKLLQIDISV